MEFGLTAWKIIRAQKIDSEARNDEKTKVYKLKGIRYNVHVYVLVLVLKGFCSDSL